MQTARNDSCQSGLCQTNVCQNGVCPIGSSNKPLFELKHLIAMLERGEEAKRQREERKKKAA